MEEKRQEEVQSLKQAGRPRFKIHIALATRGSQSRVPEEAEELDKKQEQQLRQRLEKALRRHYPASKISTALAEIERQVQAGASLEERVCVLESIPAVFWGLDRQIRQAAVQMRPILEAAAECSRMAPQFQAATAHLRSLYPGLDDAQGRMRGIEPRMAEMTKTADEIRRLQPAFETAGSMMQNHDALAAKNLSLAVVEDLLPVAVKMSATTFEAASRTVFEKDAINGAMENFQSAERVLSVSIGETAMARSIFDDFNDPLYGYNSAVREIERAMGLRRELERAMGFDREIERIRNQEELYQRARGFDSAQATAIRKFSASRYLLEAALLPLPDLGSLSGMPNVRPGNISGAFGRLNRAIANAPVIGEVEVQEENVEVKQSEEEARESSQDSESKLVKVVPAEILTQVRLPLAELNRVLRHPEAMRMLSAREFEQFIATLIEQLGFEDVFLTPPSGDQGRDVLATKKIAGIPLIFAFECKRYSSDRPVGPDIARALLGTILHGATRATMGVLVTTSTFTPAARKFILTEPVLDGKDFDGVVEWLKEYSTLNRVKSVR